MVRVSRQSVLATILDSGQVAIEPLVEVGGQSAIDGSVAVTFFQTVERQVLVGQLELVGKQFSARVQPRQVSDPIDADAALFLAVTFAVVIETDPVLGSDDRFRCVDVSGVQWSYKMRTNSFKMTVA